MSGEVADFRLTMGGNDLRGDLAVDAIAQILDITARVRPRLISLSLAEKRGGEADQLDIVLDDADGRLELPRKGAVLRLALGWRRGTDVPIGLVGKGAFKVDEVDWIEGSPDQVRITARSADLTAGFRVRRERVWRDTTIGAIVRAVAADAGLTPVVAADLAAIAVPTLSQQQSDMALLRRLGREHDAVATVKDGRLILAPIGRATGAGGATLPAFVIARGDGAGGRYREIDRSGDAGVEARWHDRAGATRETVRVGGGDGGKTHRLRRIYNSEADARAAARAEHGRRQRGAAEFEYTLALGRPDLYPERPVTLRGFKPQADAKQWLLAELSHTLDGQAGLVTRVKLETRAGS